MTFDRLPIGVWALLFFATLVSFGSAIGQELTPKEKQVIRGINQNIDRAGKYFQSQKLANSAEMIGRAIEQLEQLTASPRKEVLDAVRVDFARLEKAHALLTQAGQTLPPIKPLPAPMTTTEDGVGTDQVSFRTAVAPILIAKCGNCHVNRNRGDFSAASHAALMNSTMIAMGKPDDSRLVEVIVSGEMPKGGLKVEPAELNVLKTWIAQGAKFDGADAGQSLLALTGVDAPTPRRQAMQANRPTGKETVSFGIDVAPVLMEQCGQCHMIQNPRGNFSMANFQALLRGGDGGNPIEPGDSQASPLIRRLRGDGVEVMPPFGKLDDKLIDRIATWIDEGAAFDGGDVRTDLATVAATVKAGAMSHADLLADRQSLAGQTWKLVMGEVAGLTVPSDNFLVSGSGDENRMAEISRLCESLGKEIRDELKIEKQAPLVKGNVSVFVFEKRYDFSEFGRMVEKREFPRSINSHWGFNTIDAYISVLLTRNQAPEDIAAPLAMQIAALTMVSRTPDMPRWFADGMGLWIAKKILNRNESMQQLDAEAESAAAAMQRADDFVTDKMPSDEAALVAYLFVSQLRAQSTARWGKLMAALAEGQTFEASFQEVYGATPADMMQQIARQNGR